MLRGKETDMCRKLDETFLCDLKAGMLRPVLTSVVTDHSVDMEIRENYINLYYRGGNLLRIARDGDQYVAQFDEGYGAQGFAPGSLPQQWVDGMPRLKQAMDTFLGKKQALEREFQQLVVRTNNYSRIANATDFFVVDIEYDNRDRDNRGRFDMVMIRWDSDGTARKLEGGYRPVLALVEMKYGENALDGNAGVVKHLEDFEMYLQKGRIPALKHEACNLFGQKRELGLVPGLCAGSPPLTASVLAEEVEMIFLLADHDPASTRLRRVLDGVARMVEDKKISFVPRFFGANFMGYGLFRENVFGIDDFRKRFAEQICTAGI